MSAPGKRRCEDGQVGYWQDGLQLLRRLQDRVLGQVAVQISAKRAAIKNWKARAEQEQRIHRESEIMYGAGIRPIKRWSRLSVALLSMLIQNPRQ